MMSKIKIKAYEYVPVLETTQIPHEDYVTIKTEFGISYKVPNNKYETCTARCTNYYHNEDGYAHCRLNGEHLPCGTNERTTTCRAILSVGKNDV